MLGCAALPGNVRCLARCDERRRGMPSIVGTWKMVGATARDRDGKPLPEPYGGKGMGRVAFTAEGRMMAVTCDARPELPRGAGRAYSSYRGNYRFDRQRRLTRVDATSDPARTGSDPAREDP